MRLIDADQLLDFIKFDEELIAPEERTTEDIVMMIKCAPTIYPPPNFPLTLDELREMDGEPVWVQSPGVPEYGSWRIVAGVDTEDGERTLFCNGDFNCRDYGKVWLAYRRKPEKGEERQWQKYC